MQKKYLLSFFKMAVGLLGVIAIATEISVGLERQLLIPANFFSYFTIESNLLAAVVFITGSVAIVGDIKYKYGAIIRGAAALYMLITGLVFGVLLSGNDPAVLTFVPWDNVVLHYLVPAAMLVDWIIDSPKKHLTFREALYWLIPPFIYLLYTLIRGVLTGWYPYPFLDPVGSGYVGVIVTVIGITLTTMGVIWLLLLLSSKIQGYKELKRDGR